ncbi:MAG: hypothetical protein AMXMBFR64_38040 [Myxococcales bacterium]
MVRGLTPTSLVCPSQWLGRLSLLGAVALFQTSCGLTPSDVGGSAAAQDGSAGSTAEDQITDLTPRGEGPEAGASLDASAPDSSALPSDGAVSDGVTRAAADSSPGDGGAAPQGDSGGAADDLGQQHEDAVGLTDGQGFQDAQAPSDAPGPTDGQTHGDMPDPTDVESPGDSGAPVDATESYADGAQDATDDSSDGTGPIILTKCPDEMGTFPPNAVCSFPMVCPMGKMCCCGECGPTSWCTCNAQGLKYCMSTEFCLGVKCSPGCPANHVKTVEGCLTCAAAIAASKEQIAAAASAHGGCTEDAGCQEVLLKSPCGASCPVAVASSEADAFVAAAESVAVDYCAHFMWVGCYAGKATCEEDAKPRCVDGQCHMASDCDPLVAEPGAPCDDGSACTVDDVCVSGQCAGSPVVCDDGNPCTADSCDPAIGCRNVAAAGPCQPAGCALGGQCDDGVCVPSALQGWTRIYKAKGLQSALAVAAHPQGGFVVGGAFSPSALEMSQPHLLRVDEEGTLLWAKTYPVSAHTEIRALSVDPDGSTVWVVVGGVPAQPNVLVGRTAPDGSLEWTTAVGGPSEEYAYAIAPLPGGGYVIVGHVGGLGGSYPWAFRIDAGGELQGETAWVGGPATIGGLRRVASTEDTVGMLGYVTTPAPGYGDVRLVVTDHELVTLSDTTYPTPINDTTRFLIAMPDGDFLAGGEGMDTSGGGKVESGWLRRLGSDGSVVWEKKLTTPIWHGVSDGTGATLFGKTWQKDTPFWYGHVTPDGTLWGLTGLPDPPSPMGILAAAPGGAALAGNTYYEDENIWLVRIFEPCEDGPCPMPGCP